MMLGFSEFCDRFNLEKEALQGQRESNEAGLQEGLLKSGAVTVYASKSRQEGDAAVRHFNNAQDILQRKRPKSDTSPCDDRLEQALKEVIIGLIHTRYQNGNALAANVAAHLLSSDSDPAGKKKKR